MPKRIGIIGAGTAGLGSAYYLRNTGHHVEVHEATERIGGIAGSHEWHGFHLDIAPHRLFTRDETIMKELLDLVPMKRLQRHSKIYLQGKWIDDPVNPLEMVMRFFPWKSLELIWTYLLRRDHGSDSFEALVLSRFGSGLHEMFFRPYAEKLFGIPTDRIDANWGYRKLRVSGYLDMLRRNTKLYFDHFHYPEAGGYGAICDRLHQAVGNCAILNSELVAVEPQNGGESFLCTFDQKGRRVTREYDVLISSQPVTRLARMLGCELDLQYRPAKLAYLLISKHQVTLNHWFYFADKENIINRVAEFRNFGGGDLTPDRTVLCCEVTTLEHFSVSRVVQELVHVHLIRPGQVVDTKVLELDCAYPIYHKGFPDDLAKADAFFAQYPNIYRVGRQGCFSHKDIDEVLTDVKQIVSPLIDGD